MENNKWANFPSVSGSWRISNEGFMENTKSVVNNLSLRAGWGRVGNQNLPAAVYESNIGQGYYPIGNDSCRYFVSIIYGKQRHQMGNC